MHFHQKIHDYLLNYRTNLDSSFNFIVRQRASTKDKNYPGGKFAQGLVFQGTNDYCFVGLVDKSGGANATKSVGLVFKPIQDGFTVNLDIVFPGETDQSLVGFYKSLASKFDDIRWDPKGTRAYKIIGDFEEGKPQLIYDWLQQYYPIIKQVAIESKIPGLIINDQKFQELQDNSQRKLKEARNSVENKLSPTSESMREKFSNWLKGNESSTKINSYLRAIDILNELLDRDIYAEKNLIQLELLYNDLIQNQRDENGPYYYKSATSYGNSGFYSASIMAFIEFLQQNNLDISIVKKNINTKEDSVSLNKILYGPPGTGKTYNTVTEAVAIIQNKSFKELKRLEREIVKKEFDTLSKKGQILFTTFHQSMSYEDFVEGIKPTLIEDTEKETQQVSYDVIGGIFKLAAARAAYNSYKEFHTESNLSYTYSQLHEAFIEMAREKISKDDLLVCETKNGSFVEIFRINKNDSIQARAKGSHVSSVAPLTKENIQKLYDTYKSVDQINHLQEVRDVVEVSPRTTEFYAVFKALLEFEKKSFKPDKETQELKEIDLTDEEVVRQFDSGVFTEVSRKHGRISSKVVLVIDEINRGNVSAIFGELITLLEEDKRLGEPNQLYITLPYSKKQFSVPSNLYVIGTMNTADRSVEALDTALRRRFTFKELMPNPSLLSDIQFDAFTLEEVLKTINERIEVLVDRDHTIGHSYFLSIDSGDTEALFTVFQNKIIPLLQEYFYHDYEKMALILGAGFIKQKKNNEVKFASFGNLDIPPIDTQLVLKDTIDNIEEAVLILLNKSRN